MLQADWQENMPSERVQFGQFILDPDRYELTRAGKPVRMERIPMDLLLLLVLEKGRLISREEIIERLWGKNLYFDTDNSINTAIRKIRTSLGDDAGNPQYVETVLGKGYRFKGQTVRASRVEPLPVQIEAERTRIMLAVLPFENMSGDPSQEYFSDGLSEETIMRLGQMSPHRMGAAIAAQVKLKLMSEEEQQLTRNTAKDPEAHDHYLRGRYHYARFNLFDAQKAVAYFQKARERDPSFGLAHSGLADALMVLPNLGRRCCERGVHNREGRYRAGPSVGPRLCGSSYFRCSHKVLVRLGFQGNGVGSTPGHRAERKLFSRSSLSRSRVIEYRTAR